MTKSIEKHPYSSLALVFFALLIVAASLLAAPRNAVSQSSGIAITGYLWSDDIGWIDLNCINSGVCNSNPFGLSIASDGTISGDAWSDNLGWISANASDLSGCPSAPCTASVQGNAVSGWFKALSADGNGWDGFISLNGSNYGPTLTSGAFSGYAWGDVNVGWIDFSRATTLYGSCTASYSCSGNTIEYTNTSCQSSPTTTCTAPAFCSAGSSVCLYPQPTFMLGGHLHAAPDILPKGTPTTLFWDVQNVASCTVSGSDGEYWSGSSSGSSGQVTTAINQQVVFTLTCQALSGVTPPSFSESTTVNVLPVFQEK